MGLSSDIINFVHAEGRNKIVFSHQPIDELLFVNVGRELSLLINDDASEENIQCSINNVLSRTNRHEQIGDYLAIENVGILFEPELRLNLRSIFDSHSKNQTLFVCCDGEIVDSKFHFVEATSTEIIDLSGLLYYNV